MAAKAPTLYLRQSCVKDLTASWKPGTFLEIGAGIGLMTAMFLGKGFSGYCQDISPESRGYLKTNLQSFGNSIQVIEGFSTLAVEDFDHLLAFEVLEHIENDLDALIEWSKFLRPNGKLIVSVPAHQKNFSKADEYVGHIRRYEKKELFDLLKNAGYQNIQIANYGFPLTGFSRLIADRLMAKDNSFGNTSIEERNLKSSYSRSPIISKYLSFLSDELYIPFKYLQRWFYDVDWGDGFVAVAEKI
jgi:SAM-dependent methyltransferase